MRKIKTTALVLSATLVLGSITANAAPIITDKENADYMMSINEDGAPNWFNGSYYSNRYEDLRLAFNTNEKLLYTHSLEYGFNESRLVTPILDVVKYREYNSDLDDAFGDNWESYIRHYFEYGISEDRENFTDFDAYTYLNMYEDLQNTFGTDLGLATRHYIEFGMHEGREYKLPELKKVYEETNKSGKNSFNHSTSNDYDSSDDYDSDSDSSDDNNTKVGFTGDKRVELDDIMYVIKTYVNDVLTEETYYNTYNNPEGILEYKITYTYDENNILKSSKTSYAEGDIKEATYDENGNISYSKISYTDGSFDEITYYETENTKTETLYRADGTKYIYIERTEDGKITIYLEYQEDGEIEFLKTTYTYDENGNLIFDKSIWADGSYSEATYENGVRTYQVDIHADGTKVESEYYKDGATRKKFTQIFTDGTKVVFENRENGNMKSCTYYDTSGNMTKQQLYDEDGNLMSDIDYTIATASNATPAE